MFGTSKILLLSVKEEARKSVHWPAYQPGVLRSGRPSFGKQHRRGRRRRYARQLEDDEKAEDKAVLQILFEKDLLGVQEIVVEKVLNLFCHS